jgi:hypothetical protein
MMRRILVVVSANVWCKTTNACGKLQKWEKLSFRRDVFSRNRTLKLFTQSVLLFGGGCLYMFC